MEREKERKRVIGQRKKETIMTTKNLYRLVITNNIKSAVKCATVRARASESIETVCNVHIATAAAAENQGESISRNHTKQLYSFHIVVAHMRACLISRSPSLFGRRSTNASYERKEKIRHGSNPYHIAVLYTKSTHKQHTQIAISIF